MTNRLLCLSIWVALIPMSSARAQCEVVPIAGEIGITPESVVVAGLDMWEVEEVLLALAQAGDLCAQLAEQKSTAAEAAGAVTSLSAQVANSSESDGVITEYDDAVVALADQHVAIEATRQQIRDAALSGLAAEKVSQLSTWRNGGPFRVPGQFKVLTRSHEEWKAIELALRAESRALRRDEPLNDEHAELLSDIRSVTAVAEAEIRLTMHLDTAKLLFAEYTN